MKQLIVIFAVLPLLMIFMLQAIYDQKTTDRIAVIQSVVYAAKEDARQEGWFTPEIRNRIKNDLSSALNVPEEEIIIESSNTVKYRYSTGADRNIYYKVSTPVKDVMAGGGLLGIGPDENTYIYTIDSYTASEKL